MKKRIDWINWKWSGPNGTATEDDGGQLSPSFIEAFPRVRGGNLVCHLCFHPFSGGDWAKQWQGPRGIGDPAPMTCKACTVGHTKEELSAKLTALLVEFNKMQQAYDPDGYGDRCHASYRPATV